MHRGVGLDGDDRMPLDADPLPADVIDRLRAWIDQGARMPDSGSIRAGAVPGAPDKVEEHWAYVKPSRPPAPTVKSPAWVRNPIDQFILARLDKEALTPAPEAPRATLRRRVTLDLTGLPPTVEELDAFLAHHTP